MKLALGILIVGYIAGMLDKWGAKHFTIKGRPKKVKRYMLGMPYYDTIIICDDDK